MICTERPTLHWIFQCFQCIHLVEFDQKKDIYNWTQDRDFILNLLPDDCLRYQVILISINLIGIEPRYVFFTAR